MREGEKEKKEEIRETILKEEIVHFIAVTSFWLDTIFVFSLYTLFKNRYFSNTLRERPQTRRPINP